MILDSNSNTLCQSNLCSSRIIKKALSEYIYLYQAEHILIFWRSEFLDQSTEFSTINSSGPSSSDSSPLPIAHILCKETRISETSFQRVLNCFFNFPRCKWGRFFENLKKLLAAGDVWRPSDLSYQSVRSCFVNKT